MNNKISKRLEQLILLHNDTPAETFIWFAIAKEYEKLHMSELAIEWYQRLVSEAPEYVGTYYHYANRLFFENQPVKSLEMIELGKKVAHGQNDKHAFGELNRLFMELDFEEE